MKLRFDDSVEEFRREFLDWLAVNRPTDEEMAADPAVSSAYVPDWAARFTRRMFDDGWLVPGWPPERGGRNAGPIETLVYLEELNKAEIPRTTNPQGLGIIAPSLLDFGTPEQIENYAMPLLRGETAACLGMSEPDAGSDLANLKTRAVLDGDDFVINGQKVWTSGANYADFCFLFCRTDPDVPKHKGISIILMPMDTPGVTVRPLTEIVSPEFPDLNEVFLDDVVLPASNLVGEMNNGWAMANGSLAHERSMVWLMGVMGMESSMHELLELAPARLAALSAPERAVAADEIAGLYVDTIAARCLGYRGFARFVKTGSAPEQALMKAYSTEIRQDLTQVAAELFGPDSLRSGTGRHGSVGSLEAYLTTFGSTISAGSSEIQRNIIAERVLGLPRA
ncbi:MAG: acyl-CoA dehydrogenase family protein [Acidimicrobiales bacterium]